MHKYTMSRSTWQRWQGQDLSHGCWRRRGRLLPNVFSFCPDSVFEFPSEERACRSIRPGTLASVRKDKTSVAVSDGTGGGAPRTFSLRSLINTPREHQREHAHASTRCPGHSSPLAKRKPQRRLLTAPGGSRPTRFVCSMAHFSKLSRENARARVRDARVHSSALVTTKSRPKLLAAPGVVPFRHFFCFP